MRDIKEEMKNMKDKIENIAGSIIQHGKLNNRVYLIKLNANKASETIETIINLAEAKEYTKIFAKIPGKSLPVFINKGFKIEGTIPNFYSGKEDAFFIAKFFSEEREKNFEHKQLNDLFNILNEKKEQYNLDLEKYTITELTKDHAVEMTKVFKEVFDSYPFPIFDSEYIKKTMDSHIKYYGIFINHKLVAISSAEMSIEDANAEMTDFAILPDQRGKKLSVYLLRYMENIMKKDNIKTLYTIARLNSIPMNKTFLRENYIYSGTLVNNTNISGRIESMNILYKHI
jgi:putative beta-lysine N-acetyltransferase